MLSKLRNKEKGFTIIEVVIVLAIAGLIFLIVFIAVPQLQRSRRDTQRRSDLARIGAQLESFAANNGGVYPVNGEFDNGGDFDPYAPDAEYQDPLGGGVYTREGDADAEDTANTAAAIDTNNPATVGYTQGPGGRSYIVCMQLETGGSFCQDNS